MIYFQPVGPGSPWRELMLYEPSIHRDGYGPSHTSLLAAFCLQVDVDEARASSKALHARITGSQKCEHDKASVIRRLFRLLKKTHTCQNSSHIPHIFHRPAQQGLALTILVLLLCIRHVQPHSLLHFLTPHLSLSAASLKSSFSSNVFPPNSWDSTASSTSPRRRSWRRRRGRASI